MPADAVVRKMSMLSGRGEAVNSLLRDQPGVNGWGETADWTLEDRLVRVYRCDYCATLDPEKGAMLVHLSDARHPTASLYDAVHCTAAVERGSLMGTGGLNSQTKGLCRSPEDFVKEILAGHCQFERALDASVASRTGINPTLFEAEVIHGRTVQGALKPSQSSLYRLVSVVKMLALHSLPYCPGQTSPSYPSPVIACPECGDLFADIFQCGVHGRGVHGGVGGRYAVHPTRALAPVTMCVVSRCVACGLLCASHSALHTHWGAEPRHSPLLHIVSVTSDNNAGVGVWTMEDIESARQGSRFIYECVFCHMWFIDKSFKRERSVRSSHKHELSCPTSFLQCKSHVLSRHKHELSYQTTFKILITQVLPAVYVDELVPFASDTSEGAITRAGGRGLSALDRERAVMRATKRHLQRCGGVPRSRVKGVRVQLRALRGHAQALTAPTGPPGRLEDSLSSPDLEA